MRIDNVSAYWDMDALSKIDKSEEAIKAFETEFLHIFLKEVRKGLEGGIFSSSYASKFYWQMFDMQMAKALGESDAMGMQEFFSRAIEAYEKGGK